MKRMLIIVGLGIAVATGAHADDSSTTPPVGYTKFTIQASTDNALSVPLIRDTATYGLVATFTSNSITIANGQWTPSQFVYAAGIQPNTYEVEFVTGALAGIAYQVVSNTQDTVVLNTQGDNLTAEQLGAINPGDLIAIRPYWTLGNVLGGTDTSIVLNSFATAPSLDQIESGDCVLFPDNVSIGIEKPYVLALAYVQQAGWRAAGDANTDQSGTILPRASVFVVHRQGGALQTFVLGNAPINPTVTPVKGGNGTMGNDYYVALAVANPVSLNSAGLTNATLASSVIQPSTSLTSRGDELLAFSGTRQGFHRDPDLTFYYVNGSWQQLGSTSTTVGQDFQLQPGVGYIIRKRPANGNQDWTQTP
jgi:uncharacterized protein (TIGR02597 family)